MDSILTSIKKLSGITKEYEHFDDDLIIYINSVFLVLKQLGVGPSEGFVISSDEETWKDFIPDNKVLRESVKAYVGAKVRLQFDPPTNGAVTESLHKVISEFEWRLCIEAETVVSEEEIQNG